MLCGLPTALSADVVHVAWLEALRACAEQPPIAVPSDLKVTLPFAPGFAPAVALTVAVKVTLSPYVLGLVPAVRVVDVVVLLSIVINLLPEEPGLPAASVWEAANVYVASAEIAVVSVSVHAPAVHVVVAGAVGLPPSVTLTAPSPVEHEPPTEEMFRLVV
jgi:hypothetical protein